MSIGTEFSKRFYKKFHRLCLVGGIALAVVGIYISITMSANATSIKIVIMGVLMIMLSRWFRKSSIGGRHSKESEEFNSTSEVYGYIKFNDITKQILVSPEFRPIIVNYSDILDFELIRDGETIISKSYSMDRIKSTVRVSTLTVKIVVRDMNNPNIYINLITRPTRTDSFYYKNLYENAQKILSMLQVATSEPKSYSQVNE